MGLFDFLKKCTGKQSALCNRSQNPRLITNDTYQTMRQKEMLYWEQKYDLSTVNGINSIPVPLPQGENIHTNSTTGQLDYYLMTKAGQYETAGQIELALACYRKCNQLMPFNNVSSYPKERYMRLPRYLRKLRRFDEARVEEQKVEKLFPDGGVYEQSKAEFIANMLYVGHTRAQAESLYKEYKAERDAERQKEYFRADYDWVWEFLPELCPKSFSAYMRIKNADSEKYREITAAAQKMGRSIR